MIELTEKEKEFIQDKFRIHAINKEIKNIELVAWREVESLFNQSVPDMVKIADRQIKLNSDLLPLQTEMKLLEEKDYT